MHPFPRFHSLQHLHRFEIRAVEKQNDNSLGGRIKEVLSAYLPLAYITFGGPQESKGSHRSTPRSVVVSRQWLSDEMFTELFAISNALPGPASTQLAFSIALIRGGVLPGILGFLIWTLPGGIIMGALGYGVGQLGASNSFPTWLLYIERSLASVSIALVAVAAKQLITKLLTDKTSCSLAALAVVLVINFTEWKDRSTKQKLQKNENLADDLGSTDATEATGQDAKPPIMYFSYSMRAGFIIIGFFQSRDVYLPVKILSTFYFIGSIIFGGGPVYVVDSFNWVTPTEFLMGFAIINIMPGPNFNFAAFCGALAFRMNGWTSFVGALLAWIGIFLPGLLIQAGFLPIWRHYRELLVLKNIFKGLNSVAVGLLAAAVFMLWNKAIALDSSSVSSLGEYPGWTGLMVVAFVAMETWKVQPWWVIGGGGVVAF
ncbi:hypothetical protein BCR33DRAFT_711204 [Rhizoclosmatium globosum]|uniref:Chromate transporter n=1 Tax=Rhizoclosmatium globosum TaxID=329046 RepID=A0A1Y2D3J8_9FUNG|nr:hypothetical protein BCR33DRAFT_711204 [Rhizoclosmatium globosum]|eukprot:ORY53869.1 hypothetical protein BCR33DRAFT_711204 [Rhizoclosmatium globosum]